MAFTDAQIATDLSNIFSSLASTGANESVTLKPQPSGTESSFNVIRAKTLSERELLNCGWATRYQLSVYAANADAAGAADGDLVEMETEGELRILNISRGPALGYVRLDLGDKYSGRL